MKFGKAVFWILDVGFWYHLIMGAFGLLTMAYFFRQHAGVEISVKRKNDLWTGVKYGLITLLTGTLIGSSVRLFFEKDFTTFVDSVIHFTITTLSPCIG